MKLLAPGREPILIHPVRPSAGEEAAYKRQLLQLVDAMHKSAVYWANAKWKSLGLAQDASPQAELDKQFVKLGKQWKKTFKEAGQTAAKGFAEKNRRHHDQAFAAALKKAGFAVKFQMTPTIERALDGAIKENVDLITSIPEKYFADVRERIHESVVGGRNMRQATKNLEEVHGLTRSRAALIVRDQNNKVTALVHKLRQKQVGITKAQWIHTTASMQARPEHEAWGDEGAIYDVDTGMYSDEDDDFVWPGTPVNCGCTSMSIIPGQEEED